jgi:hypothetical protein
VAIVDLLLLTFRNDWVLERPVTLMMFDHFDDNTAQKQKATSVGCWDQICRGSRIRKWHKWSVGLEK